MLELQASLRRLLKVDWGRLRLEPRTNRAEQMIMRGTLAGARALPVTAREIFGGEPPPGTGLIQDRACAMPARGGDISIGYGG